MSASVFGPGTQNTVGDFDSNFTVLSDGRYAQVFQGYGSSIDVYVQFYAPDGTALGAPVVLNQSGTPNFSAFAGGNDVNPLTVPLANDGFAVLAEDNSNSTTIDDLAVFDSQGNQTSNGWYALQNASQSPIEYPDQGLHSLLALSNTTFYVAWSSDAGASLGAGEPVFRGYSAIGNSTSEGRDALTETVNASGTISTPAYLDDATFTDGNAGGMQYIGLLGDQDAATPLLLSDGSIVQIYTDPEYYAFYAADSNQVEASEAIRVSINGGPRLDIFFPGTGSNGGPTNNPQVTPGSSPTGVALAGGEFAVIYTLTTNADTPQAFTSIVATFGNSAGDSIAPGQVVLASPAAIGGSGNVSAVGLPNGGFAIGYIDNSGGGNQVLVNLYDSSGNLTQSIPLTGTLNTTAVPSLQVAPDGSLYVRDDGVTYHIAGLDTGDVVIDHSASATAETLIGTSLTNNWIYAGAGATSVVGGPGAFDHIYAGSGDDSIVGGPTQNFIEAGAGIGSIDGGGGATTVFFDGDQDAYTLRGTATDFTVTNNNDGDVDALTDVQTLQFADGSISTTSISCFLRGTRIATPSGAVDGDVSDTEVENLAIGGIVQLAGGGTARIAWLGYRHIDCRRHRHPAAVWPIRVRAGAFGERRPHRDLFLSPDHAVFIDGALIPVKHLLNGISIVQVNVPEVTYFHVELPEHDVLLAEGLPTESYLDTGDRANFANGGGEITLHPDFASRVRETMGSAWETMSCAPLIVTGPRLAAARRLIDDRVKQTLARELISAQDTSFASTAASSGPV